MRVLEVEIYDTEKDPSAQARFLVHGYDDVYWTDNPTEAANIIFDEMLKILESR